ncbi:HORMA domain-containing protein 1 [Spea bombifrons]|uniref:HORMA domain-containing protein 1 n=1 Tax=Spea bombifrons TaxID=233779 RepID=UPI00234A11C3|nr:HORMA domain-containing protein 1 [Spea bombifrons]
MDPVWVSEEEKRWEDLKMATAQMQRSAVNSVALPSRVVTEQQSLFLVKRLLAVSVSCIAYLRGLFPESAFGTRYIEDICVKILREDKKCPGSTQLVKWMLGCYDALGRKYLRMVVLLIYTNPDDPQTFTECYQFKFKYTASGPAMDFTSTKGASSVSVFSDIRKASVMLIRKLYILMQNLGPLSSDVCLTMKLFYYDEVTPADYHPPGFKEGTCGDMMFEGEPMYLNVGEVATPFHVLKVKVTTEKDRIESVEKTILREGETTSPEKSVKLDLNCGGEPDSPVQDDPVAADTWEKDGDGSVNIEEPSLTCQENEIVKSDENEVLKSDKNENDIVTSDENEDENSENESSQNAHAQVEESRRGNACPLFTARKTRSGRIIPYVTVNLGAKGTSSTSIARESRKTRQPVKAIQPLEIPRSQDEPVGPKRRKFSEPKDLF